MIDHPITVILLLIPAVYVASIAWSFIVESGIWLITNRMEKHHLEQEQSAERWKIIRLHQWTKRMTFDEAVKFGIEQRALIEGGGIAKYKEWNGPEQALTQAERGMGRVNFSNHYGQLLDITTVNGERYAFPPKRPVTIPDGGTFK